MPKAVDVLDTDTGLREHWFRRVIAGLIDMVVVNLLSLLVLIPLIPFINLTWWSWYFNFLQTFVSGLLFVTYSSAFEAHSGATLGKQILGIRAVALQGEMTGERAVTRNISKIHGLIFVIDILAGVLTEGDPRQRYMDRVAGTTVTTVQIAQPAQYQSPTPPVAPGTEKEKEPVYAYDAQKSQAQGAAPDAATAKPQECECGGRLIPAAEGRAQCIRCGKVI